MQIQSFVINFHYRIIVIADTKRAKYILVNTSRTYISSLKNFSEKNPEKRILVRVQANSICIENVKSIAGTRKYCVVLLYVYNI